MRLICPNCSAQYEVDDSVIPAEGRDVQCSNCGQTWFQPPAAVEPEPVPDDPAPEPIPEPAPVPIPDPVAEVPSEDEYVEDEVEEETEEEVADAAPADEELSEPDSVVSFDQGDETFYEFEGSEPAEPEPDTPGPVSEPVAEITPEPEAEPVAEAAPEPEAEPEAEPAPEPMAEATPEPEAEPMAAASPEAERPATADPEDDADTDAPTDGAEAAIAGLLAGEYGEVSDDSPPTPRRALDEKVVSVLREEAEHEQRARAAEENDTLFGGQREMGLQGAAVTALAGTDDDDALQDDRDAGSRRDLLPDIEEINSTLRATSERHGQFDSEDEIAPDHELEPRSNTFGRSFSIVIVLAGLLVALYIFAPEIAEQLPAAQPALDMFTGGVDAGRVALDDLLRSLVDKMTDTQDAAAQ